MQADHNLRKILLSEYHLLIQYIKGKKLYRNIGPKMWKEVPEEIKSLKYFTSFKKGLKRWIPRDCQCRLYNILKW